MATEKSTTRQSEPASPHRACEALLQQVDGAQEIEKTIVPAKPVPAKAGNTPKASGNIRTKTFPITLRKLIRGEAVILGTVLFNLDRAHERSNTTGRFPIKFVHQPV